MSTPNTSASKGEILVTPIVIYSTSPATWIPISCLHSSLLCSFTQENYYRHVDMSLLRYAKKMVARSILFSLALLVVMSSWLLPASVALAQQVAVPITWHLAKNIA